MRVTSSPELRVKVTDMLRSSEPVLIFHSGRVAGIYFPLVGQSMQPNLKRQLFRMAAAGIGRQLRKGRAGEDWILADFRKSRRARRS